MQSSVKLRLSIMMFAQSSLFGLLIPSFSLYLKKILGFTGIQIGWIISMSAISAIISPVFGAVIADRLISSEKYFALSFLMATSLFILLSLQNNFLSFFLLYLLLMLTLTPTDAMANAIVLHHLKDGKKEFGKIRVFGTIGWIVAGWSFSLLWLKGEGVESAGRLKDLLSACTIVSFCLSLYALTLPQTHVLKKDGNNKKISIFPKEALLILKEKMLIISLIFGFIITFIFRFYFLSASIFLSQLGFKDGDILPAMSISQLPEILMIFFMGFFLTHFGFKKLFFFALFMQWIKFSIFLYFTNKWFILCGLLADGISFPFSLASLIVLIDSFTNKETRTSVHQIYSLCIYGVGGFLGDNMAGFALDLLKQGDTIDFSKYWLIPWGLSILGMIWIAVFFKEDKNCPPKIDPS